MKSGWLVGTDYSDTKKSFIVYRLIDATATDVPENREVEGRYSSHDYALKEARKANAREAERFWNHEQ